jgi:hypothetical protein
MRNDNKYPKYVAECCDSVDRIGLDKINGSIMRSMISNKSSNYSYSKKKSHHKNINSRSYAENRGKRRKQTNTKIIGHANSDYVRGIKTSE